MHLPPENHMSSAYYPVNIVKQETLVHKNRETFYAVG